jgi:hypothetical protein
VPRSVRPRPGRFLGRVVVERRPGERCDLAGQQPPVDADQRGDALAGGREAGRLERVEPRGDPRLDRVDERTVEVEQDGGRDLQRLQVRAHAEAGPCVSFVGCMDPR